MDNELLQAIEALADKIVSMEKNLKDEMGGLKDEIGDVKHEVIKTNLIIENEIRPSIKLLI